MSTTPDFEQYRQWVGRKQQQEDEIAAWPVKALAATLDRDDPAPAKGDELPSGWHWMFFLEAKPAREVGADGHPRRGGFLPPVELPRRMWAGGSVEVKRALRVGESVRRESEILSVEPKTGRSGTMVFVKVRQSIYGSGELALVELQDIVYREAAKPGEPAPAGKPAPANPAWSRTVTPDQVMLFRYSALTFNGHRIHYDQPYVTGEEHYPGLVVHGPLQASLLLDLCRRQSSRAIAAYDYRAMSPAFAGAPLGVCGNPAADGTGAEVWTQGPQGGICMSMKVKFA